MTFRRLAFNNVLRNKRTYAAFFLSSAFSVMVFFVYAVFAFHPDLTVESLGGSVSKGFHFAEAIIYVFSFFFVLFSMSAFLKSRKKELGLLVLHGMTNMQLKTMVFLENLLIGLFSTVTGILIGIALAKTMLLIAENLLELDQSLPFYLPTEAVLLTFAAFIVLFLAISLFTVTVLRGNKLIDLIKGSAAPKPEPRASIGLSLLAAALLATGYGIALTVSGVQVVAAMIPVTLIVIIGTYFLFTQLSVFIINVCKRNRLFFWRKTNLLLFSDLAYRMKDNARTFFMVAIVSTVAFASIGSLVGFKTMFTESLLKEHPFAFEYLSYDGNSSEHEDLDLIETRLKEEGFAYKKYKVVFKSQPIHNHRGSVMVIKSSEYNAIAEATGEKRVVLKGNEAVIAEDNSYIDISDHNSNKEKIMKEIKIQSAGGYISLKLVDHIESSALPSFGQTLIVADEQFEQLNLPGRIETFYTFDIKNWNDTVGIGKSLEKELRPKNHFVYGSFFSLANELKRLNQQNGAILFVGLFIGAVFFVAAGSFLYFRLYTDLEEDKRKFIAITKLGLTEKELSKVITAQLILLFFAPIMVAVIHGAVALTSLQRLFHYDLVKESALVLGSFFAVQVVYFILIRSRYVKHIKSAL